MADFNPQCWYLLHPGPTKNFAEQWPMKFDPALSCCRGRIAYYWPPGMEGLDKVRFFLCKGHGEDHFENSWGPLGVLIEDKFENVDSTKSH